MQSALVEARHDRQPRRCRISGSPFVGAFGVDTLVVKKLYRRETARPIRPGEATSSKPRRERLLFGCSPYESKAGVQFIEVVGLVFRDAANFPQRAAVWLPGNHNLVEACVIEDNAGQGVNVGGTLRRCVIRNNGSIGGGAHGKRLRQRKLPVGRK